LGIQVFDRLKTELFHPANDLATGLDSSIARLALPAISCRSLPAMISIRGRRATHFDSWSAGARISPAQTLPMNKVIAFLILILVRRSAAQPLSFEWFHPPPRPPFRALKKMKISGALVTLDGYNTRWLVAEGFRVKEVID
jgi:hypothetical protein